MDYSCRRIHRLSPINHQLQGHFLTGFDVKVSVSSFNTVRLAHYKTARFTRLKNSPAAKQKPAGRQGQPLMNADSTTQKRAVGSSFHLCKSVWSVFKSEPVILAQRMALLR